MAGSAGAERNARTPHSVYGLKSKNISSARGVRWMRFIIDKVKS